MNLNTFGGYIKDGDYDVIITHGNAVLSERAIFDTLVVEGILQTGTCQGRRIVLEGGMLSSSSGIIADSISGHGSVHAATSLRAAQIDFTGDLASDRLLSATGRIRVKGSVEAQVFRAQDANVTGHIRVQDHLEAERIEVSRLHTAMFERFGMDEYLKPNEIQGIEARTVTLRNTVCGDITADTVRLAGNSHAQKVKYDNDLRLDRTSSVTVIEHRWKEDEDDEPQRKVA
ncbi:hypothetical protein OZX73_04055 [Bifidobacterium sp. ESL0775]|uniref:hypothetical protein n=1 Tax=Bifidobacterium sp. ESL0775 TaxID=2983230 RepID=UPI0023F630F9|nr:hypothetical protein [Bifidobacterium sp. ESL0775]WEV68487.1 hypothetical protein OZX73_04055 [Bifidobacterium sp. ESL0775]